MYKKEYQLLYYNGEDEEPTPEPLKDDAYLKGCDYCGQDVPLGDFGTVDRHTKYLCEFCADCYITHQYGDLKDIKIHINKMMNVLWNKIERKLDERVKNV